MACVRGRYSARPGLDSRPRRGRSDARRRGHGCRRGEMGDRVARQRGADAPRGSVAPLGGRVGRACGRRRDGLGRAVRVCAGAGGNAEGSEPSGECGREQAQERGPAARLRAIGRHAVEYGRRACGVNTRLAKRVLSNVTGARAGACGKPCARLPAGPWREGMKPLVRSTWSAWPGRRHASHPRARERPAPDTCPEAIELEIAERAGARPARTPPGSPARRGRCSYAGAARTPPPIPRRPGAIGRRRP